MTSGTANMSFNRAIDNLLGHKVSVQKEGEGKPKVLEVTSIRRPPSRKAEKAGVLCELAGSGANLYKAPSVIVRKGDIVTIM